MPRSPGGQQLLRLSPPAYEFHSQCQPRHTMPIPMPFSHFQLQLQSELPELQPLSPLPRTRTRTRSRTSSASPSSGVAPPRAIDSYGRVRHPVISPQTSLRPPSNPPACWQLVDTSLARKLIKREKPQILPDHRRWKTLYLVAFK